MFIVVIFVVKIVDRVYNQTANPCVIENNILLVYAIWLENIQLDFGISVTSVKFSCINIACACKVGRLWAEWVVMFSAGPPVTLYVI